MVFCTIIAYFALVTSGAVLHYNSKYTLQRSVSICRKLATEIVSPTVGDELEQRGPKSCCVCGCWLVRNYKAIVARLFVAALSVMVFVCFYVFTRPCLRCCALSYFPVLSTIESSCNTNWRKLGVYKCTPGPA